MAYENFNADELRQFTGAECWYEHYLLKWILYTDGVQYLAEHAGAYWLIDEIAFAQKILRKHPEQHLQIWKLKVKEGTALLTCIGDKETTLYSKRIPFTDFPLDEFTLYFANNVIHLPSEY